MKARMLLSMAVGITLAAAAAAQAPQGVPAPYQPVAAATQPAALPPANAAPTLAAPPIVQSQPAPVIHYHMYGSSAAAAPCVGCEAGRKSLFRDPFGACCGQHGCGTASGAKSWCRDPYAAWKARCAEVKQRCAEKSCGYGKTLNDMGCGGCKRDCDFIFSSCNDFFQEPCRKIR